MTIFFDLDGTLLDHDASERSAAVEFFSVYKAQFPGWSPLEFADRWQTVAQKHLDRYLAGRLSFTEQRRERLRELFGLADVALDDRRADEFFDVYLRHYEASWRLFPEVGAALESLEAFRLGLISNGDGDQQRRKLASLGLTDRFTPVLISDEVGAAKPEAAIFHEACRRADCPPQESVYVGDRLETDALASRRAGLHGIWLDRSGLGPRRGDLPTISSLDELPSCVRDIQDSLHDKTARDAERPRSGRRASRRPRLGELSVPGEP